MTELSEGPRPTGDWWRRAVVYQIYIRSFSDANGDGIGDIAGIRQHLPYLADLGIDAIWITPWYPSPMADGGYDVADYRDIEPVFGTLEDGDELVADAHAAGIRVLIDLVPNHTSDQHEWFKEALASPRGSAARARYLFVDGRGPGGEQPPNNWPSLFGGPAWVRVPGPAAEQPSEPDQWYLHVFAPEQPDLNWENPEVHAEFATTLRFWLDRGVDGFRIDVAHAMVKAEGLPDLSGAHLLGDRRAPGQHPHWDLPGVHDIHRAWRRITDSYGDGRVLIGEIGVEDQQRLTDYLRPDELHAAFNFPFMGTPWDAPAYRAVIDDTLEAHRRVGATPTWVLSNHDSTRQVTRLGRAHSGFRNRELDDVLPTDLELGTRRARAAILLMLALPGCAYLYQGEELGLWEAEDLPESVLQDPIWERSGHTIRGRDGCRVPLPWDGDAAPFGFSPAGSEPWLPQPAVWRTMTAEAESRDDESMLALYRTALRLRRETSDLGAGGLDWLPSPSGTLLFRCGDEFHCAVNVSADSMTLPPAREQLVSSVADSDVLPRDAAAWYLVRTD